MRRRLRLISVLLLVVTWGAAAANDAGIHHGLQVRLDLEDHSLEVVDRIQLSQAAERDAEGGIRFVLHAGLDPEFTGRGWRLERMDEESPASFLGINATSDSGNEELPLEVWRLVPEEEATSEPVVLRYGGRIHHDLATSGEEYQRSFSETPGIIDERGRLPRRRQLLGTDLWRRADDLRVGGQRSVRAVGCGEPGPQDASRDCAEDGSRTTAWRLDHPTEEVYLVAGPWVEYSDRGGRGRDSGVSPRG